MNTLQVHEFLILVNETLRLNIPSDQFVVEGEVSDYRVSQQKWISFDLKDEEADAVLKCFATVWQLKTPLEDGMRVQVAGYPKIYERFGTFKMNVTSAEPVGEGALRRAYELLKKKLLEEGLFDPARKRLLPRFVNKIGLITSRDAAAYGDFLQILNNRWGGVVIEHAHVHVQGREAVGEILGAFGYFDTLPVAERPDVIVLTRGGGGLEDLHAFNDEEVARALFRSKVPVVCAVGHERDESLCDFVADVRASTPSNAAERIVPDRREILYEIEMMQTRFQDRLQDELSLRSDLIENLMQRTESWLGRLREGLEYQVRILKSLDPQRVLARGYSIVTKAGKIVKDATKLDAGDKINVQLNKGSVDAEVSRDRHA
ncbi:MAG: exodeoxyribonuclease VII large subunit [Candidatus Uhrbacteria bacterium]